MLLSQTFRAMFIAGYTECAFWTEADEIGYAHSGELAEDAERTINHDCEQFMTQNANALLAASHYRGADYLGHDFWLTRNGHGTGYWDRDELPEVTRAALTQAAERAGQRTLYQGDSGLIYHM